MTDEEEYDEEEYSESIVLVQEAVAKVVGALAWEFQAREQKEQEQEG